MHILLVEYTQSTSEGGGGVAAKFKWLSFSKQAHAAFALLFSVPIIASYFGYSAICREWFARLAMEDPSPKGLRLELKLEQGSL